MTEEEKKAIEYLENSLKSTVTHKEQLNIIKNLIQKQQKELKILKDKNKDLLRKLRNRVKEVKKLSQYTLYKKEFSRLNIIIQKQQKEIEQLKEENKNLKDIDLTCVYLEGFYDGKSQENKMIKVEKIKNFPKKY